MYEHKYFLSFLEGLAGNAALSAKKMDELMFEDPASSIVKARMFSEELINEVFKNEQINLSHISTLYERISFLSRNGYITKEVQQNLDQIRLIGNKAAHNGNFNDMREAFKLHKVMYQIALWFYEVYSLEELKIPPYDHPKPKSNNIDDIRDIVKKQIREEMASQEADVTTGQISEPEGISTEEESVIIKDLDGNESYLIRELRRLQDSSLEAVENIHEFSSFKKYIHVERKVQRDLEDLLQKNHGNNKPTLILLCGSVGDGKSHLLSYLRENKSQLLEEYTIFNDATESFSPEKDAMETLEENLKEFSDEQLNKSNKKAILAINMGVLHNFINRNHKKHTFTNLINFVEKSELFTQKITTTYSQDCFDLLSFGDYHTYELTNTGPQSNFFNALMRKVFDKNVDNPFYAAYKEDYNKGIQTIIHKNYEFLQDHFVQKQIINLVIQTVVKDKLVVSARAFLNFIANILIPDEGVYDETLTDIELIQYSVPSLLFKKGERSSILSSISKLDPIHTRSEHIDEIVIKLNTMDNWEDIVTNYVQSDHARKSLAPFLNKDEGLSPQVFDDFLKSLVRLVYLTNDNFSSKIIDQSFKDYMMYLYYFNSGEKIKIREFYERFKQAIYEWKGSPDNNYIYINKSIEKFRLAQTLNIKPSIDHLEFNKKDVIESFKPTIVVGYHDGDKENTLYIEIDFTLYKLLTKVLNGYCPNKKDEEDAIKFVEFIEKIMKFGSKKEELMIHIPKEQRFYKLRRDDFDTFVFERV
ncbi:DNA phosphorothioation-dependent restriction protein DptF [Tuberibacillus sp. Marseille-P3662]|uniref:DNA phosphorothioation-dependent restriction protein DptF n=1 Tax=Tuberibacillus sp. Marseille-P3662 TaxID=1965358 RepID=UPI000A1C9D50|nr:DNA phosphorothioation-dependent restriction protein DptF [Tuberibacillus sp. Marseille-P3662]